jgi:hypothetical protein
MMPQTPRIPAMISLRDLVSIGPSLGLLVGFLRLRVPQNDVDEEQQAQQKQDDS